MSEFLDGHAARQLDDSASRTDALAHGLPLRECHAQDGRTPRVDASSVASARVPGSGRPIESANGSGRTGLEKDVERLEIDLLLEGIRRRYGYDFTHYSFASLKRRLLHARDEAECARFTDLLDRLLHDERVFDRFLKLMSITVTEMFRDPPAYRALRERVIPVLRTFPFVKIWHAGCATGEEVYSMAILLLEEGLLDRTRIYATDFNKDSLATAEEGVYPAKSVDTYAANYRAAGGSNDFSAYCSASYDFAKLKDPLKERITFAYHNLVTDGVFGEMNLICCRNVLIYFDESLQDRVLALFADSLRPGGFLCLGTKESLSFSAVRSVFEPVDAKQRIFRKKMAAHG